MKKIIILDKGAIVDDGSEGVSVEISGAKVKGVVSATGKNMKKYIKDRRYNKFRPDLDTKKK